MKGTIYKLRVGADSFTGHSVELTRANLGEHAGVLGECSRQSQPPEHGVRGRQEAVVRAQVLWIFSRYFSFSARHLRASLGGGCGVALEEGAHLHVEAARDAAVLVVGALEHACTRGSVTRVASTCPGTCPHPGRTPCRWGTPPRTRRCSTARHCRCRPWPSSCCCSAARSCRGHRKQPKEL